jgi:hypothetical protein
MSRVSLLFARQHELCLSRQRLPVFVHGMAKTESSTGVIRPDKDAGKIVFNVPAERRVNENVLHGGARREGRFFVRELARGKHSIAYRMRAEIPGRFSALPARAYALYAPELKGNSDAIS